MASMTALVKVANHMPLTARPSDGLKEKFFAVCFIPTSSAQALSRRTSSQLRAYGLVHFRVVGQFESESGITWNLRPAPRIATACPPQEPFIIDLGNLYREPKDLAASEGELLSFIGCIGFVFCEGCEVDILGVHLASAKAGAFSFCRNDQSKTVESFIFALERHKLGLDQRIRSKVAGPATSESQKQQ